MKVLQQQNAWILQILMYDTERRRLSVTRHLPPPVTRRRVALRRNGVTKLAVTFEPEGPSWFEPAIAKFPGRTPKSWQGGRNERSPVVREDG
jgi:hypothetical protein